MDPIIQALEKEQLRSDLPAIRVGDTLRYREKEQQRA